MIKVQKYKTFGGHTSESTFGTIADIQKYMEENGIPEDAEIEYAGCGSHNIEFVWWEEVESVEIKEGETVKVEFPLEDYWGALHG